MSRKRVAGDRSTTLPSVKVWLVDPISYSGMSYSDAGQVSALRELGADAVLLGADEWMLGSLTSMPRAVVFRGTHRPGSRVRRGAAYLVSLTRLVRLVGRHRPDVVHWQYLELPIADLTAMLAIRLLGVPQVYTAHELLPWTARPYHRAIFRALYAVVDQVVAHRADQREALIRHFGVPPRRISVIALGGYAEFVRPSLTQSDARTRLGIPAGARVALFFGAIRPSKGLDVLLAAWPAVSAIIPDALLLVVGKPYKGMRVEQLDETIRGSGLAGRVRTDFRQVEPTAANDYYRAADVVVLPYDEIGTSGVLRYAYGSARAVVATSVGEHSAHVVPGETGELVPPGDPEALAQALGTVLGDTSYARALGQNGLAYASRNFAWSDSAALLLGLYRTLTERADPRGSDMRGLRP